LIIMDSKGMGDMPRLKYELYRVNVQTDKK
jgi:hypothetical protein